jgi:hypothetical protein
VAESSQIVTDPVAKKPSAWIPETKSSTIKEIPIIKSIETPVIEKSNVTSEQKTENEVNPIGQTENESTGTNKKKQ